MLGSVHIVRYPSLWRTFVGYNRVKACLATTPGLRFFHGIVVGMSAVPSIYTPDQVQLPKLRNIFPFHVTFGYRLEPRTAHLLLWDHEEALERFLSDSPVSQYWREAAQEAWHVRLQPVFAKGAWIDGQQRFPAVEKRSIGNGPILSVVHVEPRPASLRMFWPTMQAVIERSAVQPGLVATAIGVDRALFSGTSLSFWRSSADAMNFGYRTPIHADALERSDKEQWLASSFMARFTPYASSGTIHGIDPLAAALNTGDSAGT